MNVIPQGATFGGCGDFEETGFKVSPVAFIEGVVTATDEERSVPPSLLAVVFKESSGEVLGFSDIATDALDRIRVVAKEKVDAVALSILSLQKAREGAAGSTKDVGRPSCDVCGCDAAGFPINEEKLDVFSAHEVSASQGR